MAVEYNQHTWGYGEELTPDRLNNIEGGVKATAEAVNEVNNNLVSKLNFIDLSTYNNLDLLTLSRKQPYMGYISWKSDNSPSQGNSCMVFGYDMVVIALSKPGGIYSINTQEPYTWQKRN